MQTNDRLNQLLNPLRQLSEDDAERFDPDQHNPEAMPLWDLLAFREDGTPQWWPMEKDGQPWPPSQRRRVLLEKMTETLPADFQPQDDSPTNMRLLLRSLRHIAFGVTSQASGILSSS